MAVRAAHVTLRDFRKYPLHRRRQADETTDVALFPPTNVVKLEYADVTFAAVHARIACQVFHHKVTISLTISRYVLTATDLTGFVALIICLVICPPATFAIATASPAFFGLGKCRKRKHLLTNWTTFHRAIIALQCANCIAQCAAARRKNTRKATRDSRRSCASLSVRYSTRRVMFW